jgi:hypothetical protein
MHDDGTIEDILQEYWRSIETVKCSSAISSIEGAADTSMNSDNGDDGTYSLSLNDLGGLFIIVYSIGAMSCIAAAVSWFLRRQGTARESVLQNELGLHDEIMEQNGESAKKTVEEGSRYAPNLKDRIYPRDQLVSKVKAMRKDLKEIQTILLTED